MGNWNITIEGHGIHHNNRDDDANAMAAEFVKDLKAKGHDITSAKFQLVSPVADDLTPKAATGE